MCLVFKTSLSLRNSDYVRCRWLPQRKPCLKPHRKFDATATFHSSASIAMFLTLSRSCNLHEEFHAHKCPALPLPLPSFRPEAYFQNSHWFTFSSIFGIPYLTSDAIAEGADVGVLLRCATKSGLGARGVGSAVGGSVPMIPYLDCIAKC
jgi:hypothetical protein